ncbi:MAG: glycosyltransferase [Candidatus Aenigmarchaeota archaeon]|nr:glycosyltransferase [Candidatus Aenigmarchaeota archaeon]
MRIVHITKYFSGNGGIESYTRTVAEAAKKAGHEVHVVCATEKKKYSEMKEGGIGVIKLPEIATMMNAPITGPIVPILGKLKPDVIHLHIPNPWAELNVFLYKLTHPKTRLIVTYHSDVISYNPLMRLFAILRLIYLVPAMNFLCDRVIATSENYVSGSSALRLSKNVAVIPIGVDTKKFRPGKNRNRRFTFLFVGRLIPYKGLDNLIEACSIVKGSGKNFILNIAGDGRLYSALKKSASLSGVTDRVRFFRNVSDKKLPLVYKQCDVFVLPSVYRSEAFGIAQLEAMASGKPVISTDIAGSGVPFVNKNNVTGIVVRPHDKISLANAMMYMMDNRKLLSKMSKAARCRAVKFFDCRKTSKRILDVYVR